MRVHPIDSSNLHDLIRIADETRLSPWTAESYLAELLNPDAVMIRLASDQNETVGFVVGRIILGGNVKTELEAEIYNIAVIPHLQGKGYGQTLFDEFSAVCQLRGVTKIWLEVRESNEKAQRFYRHNGFEAVQTRKYFYNNPREHAILMRLDLPS